MNLSKDLAANVIKKLKSRVPWTNKNTTQKVLIFVNSMAAILQFHIYYLDSILQFQFTEHFGW